MKPFKYKTALQTQQPGYLAKRMKAYARLERMRAKASNVEPLKRKTANGS